MSDAAPLRLALLALIERLDATEAPGLSDTLVREQIADYLYTAAVLGENTAPARPFGVGANAEPRVADALRAFAEAARPLLSGVPEDERAAAVWDVSVRTDSGLGIDDFAGAL